MKFIFYKLTPPRSTFPADMSEAERVLMERHAMYWRDLVLAGKVLAVGPVMDPAGAFGIAIARLEDGEDPGALAAQDPVSLEGEGFIWEHYPMPSLIA